jgi:hypothetical protein|eukprot:COSAG01_NODE_1797_length_9211_cov_28.889816_6_plen_76_part_00
MDQFTQCSAAIDMAEAEKLARTTEARLNGKDRRQEQQGASAPLHSPEPRPSMAVRWKSAVVTQYRVAWLQTESWP